MSRAYQSPAAGPPGQPDFVNVAVALETDLPPQSLRDHLRAIEAALGRVRGENRYAPRPIDLDLVLYEDLVGDFGGLTLPDPDLLKRPYLAVTVAELDPTALHPVSHESLSHLAGRLGGAQGLTARLDIETEPDAPPPSAG